MNKHTNALMLLILGVTVTLAGIQGTATAQTETCVTDKCHARMGKEKAVHNPVKEGMCTTCHQALADEKGKHPGKLTIALVQKGDALCAMCHEPKNKKKVVHAPVQGGDCTSCHDPHQSPNKGMLKEAMPKLCFQCHQESMVTHQVVHPPVAAGDCSGCHDNHQSDNPNRLLQPGNALCYTCHPDKEEGVKSSKSVHAPVKQSCILCHNPHSSANKAMLNSAVPALCSNCHPNEAGLAKTALSKHAPMTDQKACRNCHDPHFSGTPKLLLNVQLDLCLGCHDKELDTEKGRIMNMKASLSADKNGHGPVKSGDCADCHNPHGSEYWRILNRYYPVDFYTSYTEGKYALCFTCHDKDAFTELHTDKATKFRNGRDNLHFVHVNKKAKGRTCRACHEVHTDSGRPHHVREFVKFNGWTMPLNFNPTSTGGSCAPGCHGEKRYSR